MKAYAMVTHKNYERLADGWQTLKWKNFSVRVTEHYAPKSVDNKAKKIVKAKPARFAVEDESLMTITAVPVVVREPDEFFERLVSLDQFYYLVEWDAEYLHWQHWRDGILTVATAEAILNGTATIDDSATKVLVNGKPGDWMNDAAFLEYARRMTAEHQIEGTEFNKIIRRNGRK